MNLKERNEQQIKQALSDTNRYFYNLHYGFDAKSDQDLVMYYIEFGAEKFAQTLPKEEQPHKRGWDCCNP